MNHEKLLFTERESCERLNIGRSTFRRLMAAGEIRPVHISDARSGYVRRLADGQAVV